MKNSTASPRKPSSKQAPHRKEKFVRGDSFPDSDVLVNRDQSLVRNGYQHRVGDGAVSKNRREAAQNEISCVVPIDSDPGDDTKGKERVDKDCKIM